MRRIAIVTMAALLMSSAARLDLPQARDLGWREYLDNPRALPPPPDMAVYFGKHAAALDAVRAQLLSGEKITWPEIVNFNELLLLTRILAAHAVSHRDWRDLEAAWRLMRPLWDRPDSLSCIVALSGMRVINGAARKMPPPAPAWFAEILTFDVRRGMLRGQLAELMTIRRAAEDAARARESKLDPIGWLREPYDLAVARNFEAVMRGAAINAARSDRCAVDVRLFARDVGDALPWWNRPGFVAAPNLGAMWERVGRFRAEREQTAKRFNLKTERCSDATRPSSAASRHLLPARRGEGSGARPLAPQRGERVAEGRVRGD